MPNVLNQNLAVIGWNLDNCEESAATLLFELFPDTVYSEDIIKAFEYTFDLKATGDYSARRNAIIAAHRARGGLSKTYFENLGNTLGLKQVDPYTVVLTTGTGNVPFIVSTYSPITSPQGPATLLPGVLTDPPYTSTPYTIIVIVTGSAGPELELEKLFDRLVPAHCVFSYTYVL